MSRRHHGGRPHRSNGPGRPIDTSRPLGPLGPSDSPPNANPAAPQPWLDARGVGAPTAHHEERLRTAPSVPVEVGPAGVEPDADALPLSVAPAILPPEPQGPVPIGSPLREDGEPRRDVDGPDVSPTPYRDMAHGSAAPDRRPDPAGPRPPNGHPPMGLGSACTAPQLRRFIKSRPYVPMHELRRRFAIDGGEDDVTSVDLASGRIYVGLPSREGSLLGELLRGGEVGYELSLDPRSPIVVGLYPMRPVARS
jgi:hypothetical protein